MTEKDKLPRACITCKRFKVGVLGTEDYGKILCYDTCPEIHPVGDLKKWV